MFILKGLELSCLGEEQFPILVRLANKHLGLSTYEKEYMALLSTVEEWRYYLKGDHYHNRPPYPQVFS